MTYLLLILISALLFVGFSTLTFIEARTGTRVLGGLRTSLDERVARIFFVIDHVNWTEFLSHTIRGILVRVVHDIAHFFLVVIRFIERQLTRMVRYLRNRRPNVLAPKPSRQSVGTTIRNYIADRLGGSHADETEDK